MKLRATFVRVSSLLAATLTPAADRLAAAEITVHDTAATP